MVFDSGGRGLIMSEQMNDSNELDETRHLVETDEVAARWQQIKKIFEAKAFGEKGFFGDQAG